MSDDPAPREDTMHRIRLTRRGEIVIASLVGSWLLVAWVIAAVTGSP